MRGSPESKQAQQLRVKADQAYAQMKWKKALDLYKEVAAFLPNDPRIGQRIADLYKRLKMTAEAIAEYKRVAHFYATDGFWAKAIAVQKMVIELDPSDVSVQHKLAEMYSKQGVQGRTVQEAVVPPPPSAPKPTGEREAIELSDDTGPTAASASDFALMGGTVSIAGASPRTMDEEPMELQPDVEQSSDGSSLGRPVTRFAGIPLFSEMNTDELMEVLAKLKVVHAELGSLICEEGDLGRSMYVIADGWVEVFTKDSDGTRIVLSRLRGGDFFGEYGLLTSGTRGASVQAKTDTELLEITAQDFDFIANKHPRIWNVLEEYLRERIIDTILRKSPVFRHLTDLERKALTKCLRPKKLPIDTVVMEQGSAGQEMYFVKTGSLTVTSNQGKDRILVGDLAPGDYFGEVAMLTGKPRTATVRTRTECELFILTRREAAPILKGNREILEKLKTTIDQRLTETSEAIKSYQEARNTLEMV